MKQHPWPGFESRQPLVNVAADAGPYDNTVTALSPFLSAALNGKRILLKPNAGRAAAAETGVTTHPEVVAAAIDRFRNAGATISIGESPITGVKAMDAFEATGIAAVARSRGCPLLDLDARDPVAVPIPDGVALRELKVCAEVLEYDLVVSIPVAKTHMHTGVTLSVKNMKGCLWKRSKVELHMLPPVEGSDDKSLNIAIADMSSVLTPHLILIDATVGMEGLGPGAGEPRRMDVVVAGSDAFAADSVMCRLMGVLPEAIPHLRMAVERGYGTIDVSGFTVTPDNWMDWKQDFTPAPENISIQFPDVEVLDKNSCSACQSTVLLFLKNHSRELFDYLPEGQPVRIAIGKGHDDLPEGTLCIGNCTYAHREKGIFVPGCPPVSSAILNAVKESE